MPCLVTLVPEVFLLSFIEGEAVIIIGKTENPWDQGIINVFFVNQLFQIKIKNKKEGYVVQFCLVQLCSFGRYILSPKKSINFHVFAPILFSFFRPVTIVNNLL